MAAVGADGFRLLDALAGADVPPGAAALLAIGTLRRVWAEVGKVPTAQPVETDRRDGISSGSRADRTAAGRMGPPGCGRCGAAVPATGWSRPTTLSPYDTEARFRTKASTTWTGYMAHFTETCDPGAPSLMVHADATPANVHDALRTAPIHAALAAKNLAPSEHLVDSAYVSADHLITAREQHAIDLVGPTLVRT